MQFEGWCAIKQNLPRDCLYLCAEQILQLLETKNVAIIAHSGTRERYEYRTLRFSSKILFL